MELPTDMSTSEASTAFADKTLDPEFLRDAANRLLAWDFVHICVCARAKMYPCFIAERIGSSNREIWDELDAAISKAQRVVRK